MTRPNNPRRVPALAAVAIGLALVLAACGASPSPSQYPLSAPRPADQATNGHCDFGHSCMGLLTPGTTYATKVFTPRLTFQVPVTGWENLSDEQGVYVILSTTSLGDDIAFLVDPHAIDVTGATVAGVNGSIADLATWLQGNDQLTVTTPTPVTVGGLDGLVMDIRIADSATAHPSDCPTRVCVPTLAGADPEPPHNWQWDWGSAGTETQRLYLLANGDSLLAIFVDSLDGTTFDSITAVADRLLATVSFG